MKRKLIVILTCLLALTGCGATNTNNEEDNITDVDGSKEELTYADKLFDVTYVHEIKIEMDQDDLDKLFANPIKDKKYHADITIDDEIFEDVAISTKGSYSLRSVAKDSSNNRYSLKVNFSKYDKEENYYGLDVFDINNNISDPSMMKDYIAYYMFNKMGVAAPLCSYAKVYLNDELYGTFLIVEEVKKAYLERNFDGEGLLYKPEAQDITDENKETNEKIEEALENGTLDQIDDSSRSSVFSKSAYTSGADLVYTNDEIESYQGIFDNEVFDTTDEDKQRLIEALKKLSEGDIENAVDVDEVITYFVVHNFTNNYDSYTGGLNHNYYLYENNGILKMLPWDYDFFTSMATDEMGKKNPLHHSIQLIAILMNHYTLN